MAVMLACALVFAAGAGPIASREDQDYRARAFVIQVPSYLGNERGLALARSDRVLRRAIELSGVAGVDVRGLRSSSKAEITSRLDLAFTVEAARADHAAALSAGYARAFRAAIPDDMGLPVRGVRAGVPGTRTGPHRLGGARRLRRPRRGRRADPVAAGDPRTARPPLRSGAGRLARPTDSTISDVTSPAGTAGYKVITTEPDRGPAANSRWGWAVSVPVCDIRTAQSSRSEPLGCPCPVGCELRTGVWFLWVSRRPPREPSPPRGPTPSRHAPFPANRTPPGP